MIKKILGILLVILFVCGLSFYLYKVFKNNGDTGKIQQTNQTQKKIVPQTTQVDKNKLPENFPSNIPAGSGEAAVLDNYNAVNTLGEQLASRTFLSDKSVSAVTNEYISLLPKQGWTIKNVFNVPSTGVQYLVAAKDKNTLTITVSNDKESGKTKVSVSNIEAK